MSKKPTDKFKSATSKLSGNEIIFCNTCYQWYMSSQYCDYCEQVYDTKDTQNQDNKDWVECETCKKWVGSFSCPSLSSQRKPRPLLSGGLKGMAGPAPRASSFFSGSLLHALNGSPSFGAQFGLLCRTTLTARWKTGTGPSSTISRTTTLSTTARSARSSRSRMLPQPHLSPIRRKTETTTASKIPIRRTMKNSYPWPQASTSKCPRTEQPLRTRGRRASKSRSCPRATSQLHALKRTKITLSTTLSSPTTRTNPRTGNQTTTLTSSQSTAASTTSMVTWSDQTSRLDFSGARLLLSCPAASH